MVSLPVSRPNPAPSLRMSVPRAAAHEPAGHNCAFPLEYDIRIRTANKAARHFMFVSRT